MKRIEIFFGIIRIPLDYLATVSAFLVAYKLRTLKQFYFLFGAPTGPIEPLNTYLTFAAIAATVLVFIFATDGMYSLKSTFRTRKEIRKIIFLTAVWFMAIIAYFFIMRIQFFSRLILGYTFIATIFFIITFRFIIVIIQKFTLKMGYGKRRVLFIGDNKISLELKNIFAKQVAYKIVDTVTFTNKTEIINKIEEFIKKNFIDEIIQTESDISQEITKEILETCQIHHINYKFVPDILQVHRTNIEMNLFKGIPVITLKQTSLDAWGRVIKRIFDWVVSLLACVVLTPVWALIGLIIKLDSKGSVIYKSKRVSEKGKTFFVYKFRSMITSAEKQKEGLMHLNHRNGPLFKIKNDPRITRFGKFLRKTSLDELPQLFNVLKGEMSLVGPRPHLVEEVEKYQKHHHKVLAIKPGITGLAQISGRSDLSFEEEVKLDIFYIENWSLWFDIVILFKTIPTIFKGESAD